jgi:hypothetical protein
VARFELPQPRPPLPDFLGPLLDQVYALWDSGQAPSVRQALLVILRRQGCADEWDFVCNVLANWGLFDLEDLAREARHRVAQPQRPPQAWRQAAQHLFLRLPGGLTPPQLEGLLLEGGLLAWRLWRQQGEHPPPDLGACSEEDAGG